MIVDGMKYAYFTLDLFLLQISIDQCHIFWIPIDQCQFKCKWQYTFQPHYPFHRYPMYVYLQSWMTLCWLVQIGQWWIRFCFAYSIDVCTGNEYEHCLCTIRIGIFTNYDVTNHSCLLNYSKSSPNRCG